MVPLDNLASFRPVEGVVEIDVRGRKTSIATKIRSDVHQLAGRPPLARLNEFRSDSAPIRSARA